MRSQATRSQEMPWQVTRLHATRWQDKRSQVKRSQEVRCDRRRRDHRRRDRRRSDRRVREGGIVNRRTSDGGPHSRGSPIQASIAVAPVERTPPSSRRQRQLRRWRRRGTSRRGTRINITGVDKGGKHSSRSSFQAYDVVSPIV